jgi:hypothetical protein
VDDFPVMRFRCFREGGEGRVPDVTFSLLPLELVPYRRLSVRFMVLAVRMRLKRKLSLLKADAQIEIELVRMKDEFSFVSVAALLL